MAAEHVDNAELNLRFMEVLGVGEGDEDGGMVQFSVKELLQEQGRELRAISEKIDQRPTKVDLDRLERQFNEKYTKLADQADEIDRRTKANEISLAKIGAVVAACGLVFGALGATAAQALIG